MLIQPLLDKLTQLHLSAFRMGLEEQLSNPKFADLSFEERLAMLVNLECTRRANSRLQRRLKKAQLHLPATLEDFDFAPSRGIDRSLVLELSQGDWINNNLNIIVSGATGAGKTFLGCALGHSACRMDFTVRYFRMPRLFQQLKLAHADGSYPKLLISLARSQLIVLDDWMRDALSLVQSQDLLDLLDDRYGRSSTMVITQVPVDSWFERFPDPTIGDAVLDRLINNAYRLQLTGDSQRRIRNSVSMPST